MNSFNFRKWQTDHRQAKSLAHFVTRFAHPAQGSVDSLPNNLKALHIVKLKKGLTERDNTITEHEKTVLFERDSTITNLSSTNTKQNNILKKGQ